MSILSDKSNKSYAAALLLLANDNYCNSIQCSYFSCLQLAKDKALVKSASPELFESKLRDTKGSHMKIIKMAVEYLNGERREKGVLLDIMTRMKRWRKNAIYNEQTFSESEASEALQNCSTVNRILNKI